MASCMTAFCLLASQLHHTVVLVKQSKKKTTSNVSDSTMSLLMGLHKVVQ